MSYFYGYPVHPYVLMGNPYLFAAKTSKAAGSSTTGSSGSGGGGGGHGHGGGKGQGGHRGCFRLPESCPTGGRPSWYDITYHCGTSSKHHKGGQGGGKGSGKGSSSSSSSSSH